MLVFIPCNINNLFSFCSYHFCLLAPEVTYKAGFCRKEEDSRVLSALLDSRVHIDGEVEVEAEAEAEH